MMKFYIGNRYSYVVTFILNYLFLGWVWKELEMDLYGELMTSVEDTLMLILFCIIITFGNREKERKDND